MQSALRISLRVFVLVSVFFLSTGLRAEERTFDTENFAVTLPAGWEEGSSSENPLTAKASLVAQNSDRSKMVVVVVDAAPYSVQTVDDVFIKNFEQDLVASGGGEKIRGRKVTVQGLSAYERLGETADGQHAQATLVLPVGDIIYTLHGRTGRGPTDQDPEIRAFLDSFRLLTPPALPQSTPPPSTAFKVGFFLGQHLIGIIGIALVIGLLVAVIVTIRKTLDGPKKRRKKRRRRSSRSSERSEDFRDDSDEA